MPSGWPTSQKNTFAWPGFSISFRFGRAGLSGCIVQVWFEADHEERARRPAFQMVETEFPDFASFCHFAETDRLIGGAILRTKRNASGEHVITRRVPCAFRGSAVKRCQLPTWTFVDE